MAKKKPNYVSSKELEEWWMGWIVIRDPYAWEMMSGMIYKICEGIATKFHPPSPDEHQEHTHDAFLMTMEKISNGKLTFTPGRAPVFNLLTTTIFRHLYSKMNKEKRRKQHTAKYIDKIITEKHPELLNRHFWDNSVTEEPVEA